jgi:hypothetical protein
MLIEATGRTLPFSREQVFDVAADIERYPDFLPGWRSARITRRESNRCYVEQVLALGFLRVQIATEATLARHSRIDISSTDRRSRPRCLHAQHCGRAEPALGSAAAGPEPGAVDLLRWDSQRL